MMVAPPSTEIVMVGFASRSWSGPLGENWSHCDVSTPPRFWTNVVTITSLKKDRNSAPFACPLLRVKLYEGGSAVLVIVPVREVSFPPPPVRSCNEDGALFIIRTAQTGLAAMKSLRAEVHAPSMATSVSTDVQIPQTATSPCELAVEGIAPTWIALEVPGSPWLAAPTASPCDQAPAVE